MSSPNHDVRIALPTADRRRAYAFAFAMGFATPGDLADDGGHLWEVVAAAG